MKQEERNFYTAFVICGNQRVKINISQYDYLWTVFCDELECGGESLHSPVEAMKFFLMRVEEYHECGQ